MPSSDDPLTFPIYTHCPFCNIELTNIRNNLFQCLHCKQFKYIEHNFITIFYNDLFVALTIDKYNNWYLWQQSDGKLIQGIDQGEVASNLFNMQDIPSIKSVIQTILFYL